MKGTKIESDGGESVTEYSIRRESALSTLLITKTKKISFVLPRIVYSSRYYTNRNITKVKFGWSVL